MQVGKIVNTHGLNGMVKIFPYTNSPEDFERLDCVYMDEALTQKMVISKVKYHKNMVIVKFKGYDHIADVERLKNHFIYMDKVDAADQLAEGEYYIEDLIGMTIVDQNDNNCGTVVSYRESSRQTVLEVEQNDKIWFLPFVDAFVEAVNLDDETIHVTLIEGMYSED